MSRVVHLFCHGMMAFWYRPPSSPGKDDDGYTILLPQSPGNMHILSLTTTPAGAPKGTLQYNGTRRPTGKFKLEFGNRPSVKNRGMKSCSECLALYARNGRRVTPDIDVANPSGVAFTLDIPYPADEKPLRVEYYQNSPYDLSKGDVAKDFDVRPLTIPRSTMFTFELADSASSIELAGGSQPVTLYSNPNTVSKIYLYSQPDDYMTTSHLQAFNEMFLYNNKALDLTLKNPREKHTCTALKDVHLPAGVTMDDARHLVEWKHKDDICDHSRREIKFLSIDPAECVQGPGC